MYAKILKETASQLTLLSIDNDFECRNTIDKNLSRFFKNITYVSSAEEVYTLYRSETFDLLLLDIDTLGDEVYRFINDVQKQDAFQAITAISGRSDDSKLLLSLLNSNISGFITKPSTPDAMYRILSKVCEQIHDRKMLLHYLLTLENQHESALNLSCQAGCPMKTALKSTVEIAPIYTPLPQEDDDDFMFFSESSQGTSSATEDLSIYQDYFTFLESDDREELQDQLGDIDASLLSAFADERGNSQHIMRLGNSLMRYGNVLLHYQFFSDMGTSILEFGKTIGDESEMIAERSSEFEMLISGFCSGLQTYMSEVWERESDNPKFFNDSIINDATTIMGMMAPPQVSEGGDEDDCFFF